MIHRNEVLLSTTPTLEGWQIIEYIGPISSQVVAGTGLFSDIAAGLSDIFGGRSESYRKQLYSINEEVLNELRSEAGHLGANCVVGLRIDHDEVSGKGKSMFMVTASGTAIIAKKHSDRKVDQANKSVSASELKLAILKARLLKKAQDGKIEWNEDDWSFIAENRLYEFVEYVIRDVVKNAAIGALSLENAMAYICIAPKHISTKHIFPIFLEKEETPSIIYEMVLNAELMDFDLILGIIDSDNMNVRMRSLKLLEFHKMLYSECDIEKLQEIVKKLKKSFPQTAAMEERKRTFSRTTEHVWVCEDGHTNQLHNVFCDNCGKDRWGFGQTKSSPRTVIPLLEARVVELIALFTSATT